jgi:pimeloyl-ACP methyl ester carboxylesterase
VETNDQRGDGGTDRPDQVERYTQLHLIGNVIGLLNALGEEQAVVVGHDWGAVLATCHIRPLNQAFESTFPCLSLLADSPEEEYNRNAFI